MPGSLEHVHSGRPRAFTTLEVPDDRDPDFLSKSRAYDPATGGTRPFRYEGVLVNRVDSTTGAGAFTRLGPAFYHRSNPDHLTDVGFGRDDHSLIDVGGRDRHRNRPATGLRPARR